MRCDALVDSIKRAIANCARWWHGAPHRSSEGFPIRAH